MTKKVLTVIAALAFCVGMQAQTLEAEKMKPGGKYAGECSSPFQGVALYANGDNATGEVSLTNGSGVYNIKVTGASNNGTAAGVALYVGGKKMADMSFSGTAPSVQEVQTKLYLDATSVDVKLNLENDNGSNDTYIDKIEFDFVKALPVRKTPVLPQQSVWQSGQYRNILQEAGYSQEEINSKLQAIKQQFFEGDAENGRLYYELGTDEAYILDTGNDDVRTESLSYGMMICVQLDMQKEFDKLWRFTKNHSMYKSGANKGYLAWQLNKDGSIKGDNAAPDGDEYIATALMFAAGRWGNNSTGIDYWKEANYILDNMLSKGHYINSSHVNMFNKDEKQIVFVPYAQSALHTDPSYHMPAFYELWSKWANNNRQFWKACADKSREMYPKFANSTTGLMPDYAEFSGEARSGEHSDFRYDAWRCAMHMATDYMWFNGSETEKQQTKKLLDFFYDKGIKDYKGLYQLNGTPIYGGDHSPGLVGCNAVGAMIYEDVKAWDFVDDFFEMTFPTGDYRYYDGCLYFLSYLHASGNFKMYRPAEVLPTALDEQYKTDNNGYLIIDDFEKVPEGKEYYMHCRDNSSSAATLVADPRNGSNHVVSIEPKSYDEYYYHAFRLPEGQTLGGNYKSIEFDILFDGESYNNEKLNVFLNDYSQPIYTESTGAKAEQGTWKHISVEVPAGNTDNEFVLGLGVRAGGGICYVDNLKLRPNGAPEPGPGPTPGGDDPTPGPDAEQYPTGNILSEGAWGFENNELNGWNSWADNFDKSVANTGYASNHCLKVENKAAAGMWEKQCVLALDNALEKGKTYTLTFKAKADVAANINTAITMKDNPWTMQGSADHSLTTEWAEYTFEQTIDMDNINRIVFNLGETVTSYYIDNISLIAKAGQGEPDPTPGDTSDSRNGTYFTENSVEYYMIEDFEDKTLGTTTDMQNNGGKATVSGEHKMEGEKALKINIGDAYQVNGCYAIDVTLPEGTTLSSNKFTAINFTIYYEAGSIQYKGAEYNSGVKVWLNDINNMIIQHDTKDCIGKTENISVPLNGKFTDENSFKLLIGGLCSDNANDGIYYIDNIRLVCVNEQGGDDPTPGPDSDAKKIVLDDFEKYAVGATPYTVENANGGFASVVSADADNKALNFTTGSNKNEEYLALTFTLPQGKTLSDYDVLTFDYAFAASGNDNMYKDIKVCIDSKNTAVGTIKSQNAPAEWKTMSIALENVQGGNSFTLYIGGINASVLSMNIDNIVIKTSDADTPTNINLQSISNGNAQEMFSIGGQRVNSSYHGIVVINGKKVVVK